MIRLIQLVLGTVLILQGLHEFFRLKGKGAERFLGPVLLLGVGLTALSGYVQASWHRVLSTAGTVLTFVAFAILYEIDRKRRTAAGIPPLQHEYRAGAWWLLLVFFAAMFSAIAPAFAPPYNRYGMYGGGLVMLVATILWLTARLRYHKAVQPSA